MVALGLLIAPLAASAQPAERVYRVGLLGGYPAPRMSPQYAAFVEALRAGLRDQGYVEGRNLVLEFRWTEGKPERVPALAAELVGLPVDVFVATSTRSALAAKAATSRVPIVLIGVADPVGSGLVSSLAHPGGNVTGLSWDVTPETSAKLLALLKEAMPKVSRVAAFWNSTAPHSAPALMETQRAARVLRVTLQALDVRSPDEYAAAFAAMTKDRAEALVVLPDIMTWANPKPILDFAAQRRLPVVYHAREFVD